MSDVGFTEEEYDRLTAEVPDYDADLPYVLSIREGMDFLDERVPGWIDKIDLAKLHVCSSERCVLAQLWDGPRQTDGDRFKSLYQLMKEKLRLDAEDTARLMFASAHDLLTCKEFTAIWKRCIRDRREAS